MTKTLYLCDGNRPCKESRNCGVMDFIIGSCFHTSHVENAKNGPCDNPEKFPERFFLEKSGNETYYTEKEEEEK